MQPQSTEFVTRVEYNGLLQRLEVLERNQERFDRIDAALSRLAADMATGFTTLTNLIVGQSERMETGFAAIDERLDKIEAHLRRISPSGQQP